MAINQHKSDYLIERRCFEEIRRRSIGTSYRSEKVRREQLNQMYRDLRSLVPNPTRFDRASLCESAIEYIKDLEETIEKLGGHVDKRRMMPSQEENGGTESSVTRSEKSTVEVQMTNKKVEITVTRKEKMSNLISVTRILDELGMEILSFTKKTTGDYYVYMFESKAPECPSSVSPCLVSEKVLEVVEMDCPQN